VSLIYPHKKKSQGVKSGLDFHPGNVEPHCASEAERLRRSIELYLG